MPTSSCEPPTRRCLLPGSVLLLFVFLLAGPSAAQDPSELTYEVDEGIRIEACGGFGGGCRDYILRGTLDLRLDRQAGIASIPRSDLEIFREGEMLSLGSPVADLEGTFDGQTARFVTPPDHLLLIDLTFTLTERGFVLEGIHDPICCDLFAYTYRNVSFGRVRGGSTRLMLNHQRFAVEARWLDFAGNRGPGRAVELNAGSGTFWFFSPDNTELAVKVLDACAEFDRFWFFASGLTNVEVELTVTDLASGVEKIYRNPLGRDFQPILDTDAFSTCGL